MRIGMVCPYSFDVPGGVQAHAIDLCEEFRSRGHEVSLIGPAGPAAEVPDFVERGGRAIPIPYNGSVARLASRIGDSISVRVASRLDKTMSGHAFRTVASPATRGTASRQCFRGRKSRR